MEACDFRSSETFAIPQIEGVRSTTLSFQSRIDNCLAYSVSNRRASKVNRRHRQTSKSNRRDKTELLEHFHDKPDLQFACPYVPIHVRLLCFKAKVIIVQ